MLVKVLVIGGTVFVGRNVVAQARQRGADVTVFHRGQSGSAPDGVETLHGDRTVAADLEQLRGRRFDLVVDTCGYVPADVARVAQLLADSCGHYAFVSSVNVFPDWPEQADYHERGAWEGNPDATRDDVPAELIEAQPYGWLKVGCELAVRRAFGDERSSVLRAGAIVGPFDASVGRLAWWIDRVARGGEVLVPGPPGDPVALIDARDLAEFALSGAPGVFECGGPTERDTRAELMDACRAATGSNATFTYVEPQWLRAQGVQPWTEVPLWIPDSEGPSVWRFDNSAAEAAGLRWRPLAETVADTWAWQGTVAGGWRPTAGTPGLAADREAQLLAAWHARG